MNKEKDIMWMTKTTENKRESVNVWAFEKGEKNP